MRVRTYRQGISYLRTVIVTAAVHRHFELALHHLTFRHRAGVSHRLHLAEPVFDKQLPYSVPPIKSYLKIGLHSEARAFCRVPSTSFFKRLGILYLPTCVVYTIYILRLFPELLLHFHPMKNTTYVIRQLSEGTGILTCFPSTTHFCLALR